MCDLMSPIGSLASINVIRVLTHQNFLTYGGDQVIGVVIVFISHRGLNMMSQPSNLACIIWTFYSLVRSFHYMPFSINSIS